MRSKETIKTFSSVNRMFSIKEDKDDKDLPYDFISSPSRINFAIIEKTEQGSKVCDVNLTKEEISDLFDQTKILYDIHIKKEMGFYDKAENDNSLCYTETFKMGILKGMIKAINDCLNKIKNGTLNNSSSTVIKPLHQYKKQMTENYWYKLVKVLIKKKYLLILLLKIGIYLLAKIMSLLIGTRVV